MKNCILVFMCAIVFSGCFEADYMCDNETTAINAARIKLDDSSVKDELFKKQIDGFLEGVKITQVSVLKSL